MIVSLLIELDWPIASFVKPSVSMGAAKWISGLVFGPPESQFLHNGRGLGIAGFDLAERKPKKGQVRRVLVLNYAVPMFFGIGLHSREVIGVRSR